MKTTFKRVFISFLAGFVLNLMGFPLVKNGIFQPISLAILFLVCVGINLLVPDKEEKD
jgi:hypothetical protein